MNILVLNVGSSSLKFQLIQTSAEQIATDADVRLARGIIERIGGHALLTLSGTLLPAIPNDAYAQKPSSGSCLLQPYTLFRV